MRTSSIPCHHISHATTPPTAAPLGYADPFADPYADEAAPDRFLLLLEDQAGSEENGMDVSTDNGDAQDNQVSVLSFLRCYVLPWYRSLCTPGGIDLHTVDVHCTSIFDLIFNFTFSVLSPD